MRQFPATRSLALGTTLLALFGTVGCAPPDGLSSADGTAQTEQHKVPFHDADGKTSSPNSALTQGKGLKPEMELPFQDPQSLPAGTLLTVRTKNSISAENPDANETFEAMVDQPVIIDGNRLVPLGAMVSGRVESARASNLKRNRGYVRLTLASIQLAGSDVPVQTSSLFVRGSAGPTQAPQSPVVRLESGRRLVFRLTEPVDVATAAHRPPTDH
jgi:hypothetical protein